MLWTVYFVQFTDDYSCQLWCDLTFFYLKRYTIMVIPFSPSQTIVEGDPMNIEKILKF